MNKIAIYSRKSKFTGKGDSIENQIDMCKDYINQKMGDKVDFLIYEDEGFSGGNIDRPAFKRLLKDIKTKKIDILICYRLDRISRNVADFSNTLEYLEENKVNFISLKEQFDTSTPMGRAMIYIASVFAQLERETIAERVKDNMLELAKNGRWTGGKIPLGFTSERIKYIDDSGAQREYSILKINIEEMEFVEFLYKKYLELGSLHKLEVYITQNELKSRNGIMFEKSSLKIILQNPIYVKANDEVISYLQSNDWAVYGEPDGTHSLLSYNKTEQSMKNGKYVKTLKDKDERFVAVSNIDGAISADLWLEVQRQFDKNRDTFPRLGKTHNALLVGKLRCGKCKEYMLVQHGRVSKSTGDKLFYYTCSLKRKSHKKLCDNSNAKAAYVEDLVIKSLKFLSSSKKDFLNRLKETYNNRINSNELSLEKLSLEKALNDKRKQIDTLTTALSKADGIEDILINKIKDIKAQCIEIEQNIKKIDSSSNKDKLNSINLSIIDSILDECAIIDTLPRDKQKRIIDNLIDCIYWYGTNNGKGKIKIKFIGTDDEDVEEVELSEEQLQQNKLQFGSPSTACIQ